jgi:2,5-diketo-D-gluconate reductase A
MLASVLCLIGAISGAPPLAPTVLIAPNVSMPAVALGTGEYRGAAAVAAVTSAIELGYRAIDTAHEYANQAAVGQAVRAAIANTTLGLTRADLFLISKVEGGLSAKETAAHLADDVAQLGLGGPIDLVLLHFPKAALLQSLEKTVQEQWRAIVAFVDGGGARAAGVSQFCAACLGYLDGAGAVGPHARPALHQFGWHVGMGGDPQGIAAATAARGDCTLMAYSPLAEAAPAILTGEPVASIAKAHGVAPAQVALRWVWQQSPADGRQGNVPYAVAAANPAFQSENLDAFGFELGAAEMAALDNATQPAGCPFWPGTPCYEQSACPK